MKVKAETRTGRSVDAELEAVSWRSCGKLSKTKTDDLVGQEVCLKELSIGYQGLEGWSVEVLYCWAA